MTLAFFGTADFSVPSLEKLLKEERDISLVVTKPDAPGKRGRKLESPRIKTLADEAGIPVIQPSSKQELVQHLDHYPDITCGVVVAYGIILPPPVLEHFDNGLINVHASLLPRWRGPSPVEAVILHGDSQTGISIMRMTSAMDSGPVYTRATRNLESTETRLQLMEELAELGAATLHANLNSILDGSLEPEAQDESRATYTKLLRKSDGEIDWNQPAETIERQIRAYLGWPGSFTTIQDTPVIIEAAHVVEGSGQPGEPAVSEDGSLIVHTFDDALVIDRVRPSGKQAITGSEFIRGFLKK